MKFGSIVVGGRETVIVRSGHHRAVTLEALYSHAACGDAPATVQGLIADGEAELDRARRAARHSQDLKPLDTRDVDWLPVQPHASKIFGVAFNNRVLMRTAHKDPGVPNFFLKPPSLPSGTRQTHRDTGLLRRNHSRVRAGGSDRPARQGYPS